MKYLNQENEERTPLQDDNSCPVQASPVMETFIRVLPVGVALILTLLFFPYFSASKNNSIEGTGEDITISRSELRTMLLKERDIYREEIEEEKKIKIEQLKHEQLVKKKTAELELLREKKLELKKKQLEELETLKIEQQVQLDSLLKEGASDVGEHEKNVLKAEEKIEEKAVISEAIDVAPVLHIVKKGQSLSRIAKKYSTTTDKLILLNNINDPDHLDIGSKVQVRK